MKDVMGIINLSENENDIKELTINRPIAGIPFGGRYRIIDFILSNFVNSDIDNVGIFTQGKFRSIQDHIGSGKHWDLDRKNGGLFMFNPSVDEHNKIYIKGDIDNFKNNMDYLFRSKEKYVLMAPSYMIYNMDFSKFYDAHIESGADVSVAYVESSNLEKFINCDTITMNENGRITGIGKNNGAYESAKISMEAYLMEKDILIDIIQEAIMVGEFELLKKAVQSKLESLVFRGHEFEGYLACINSIENYYDASLDILDTGIARELFFNHGPIYTKIKDEPPAKYTADSKVRNSLVANGVILEGQVENSILSRRVIVKEGSTVKNCIIMQRCTIEKGCHLENVILDKNVIIGEYNNLSGVKGNPLVIKKDKTI